VKLEAVGLYTEEGKSQAEIIEELGIHNVRRVKQWLHEYRQAGERALKRNAEKDQWEGHPSEKTQKRTLLGWKWRTIC
jgi:transposase-like protein